MYATQRQFSYHIYSLMIVFAIFLGGCVTLPDPEVSQDLKSDIVGIVNSKNSLGQTIEIRRDNFNGITLWVSVEKNELNSSAQNQQLIHIDLFSYTEPLTHLHRTTVELDNTLEIRPVFISFSSKINSANKIFYLNLSTDSGFINVYGVNEDNYPNGQAYIDNQALNADIAFSTNYDYDIRALLEDWNHWRNSAWLIPHLILILLVPGLVLLRAFEDHLSLDIGQIIGICVGLSITIISLLILWTSTIGVAWNKTFVYFISGILTSILVISYVRALFPKYGLLNIKRWITKDKSSNWNRHTLPRRININQFGSTLALLFIFLITLVVRMVMVRDLVTPAWVDSIHHALIARIIVETGALPETYLPYLNIEPTFYHPGFHAQIATFNLLADLDLHDSMLIFGQVANALMIFVVYSLSISMTNNRYVGIFAALITGLITPMPAYYTSWGRYTQLTGLLILPICYIFYKKAIYRNDDKLITSPLIIGAISASGLILVHYRVTAFLALLIISDISIGLIYNDRSQKLAILRFKRILLMVLMSGLLTLPWLIQAIPETFIVSLTQPIPKEIDWFADFSWRYLTAASGKLALVIGGLGLFWGLLQNKQFAYIFFVWLVLLAGLANTSAMGVPGGIYMNTTSVEISLFIPIAILAGYFIWEIIKSWKQMLPVRFYPGVNLAIGLLIASLYISYAAKNIPTILNPVTFLSRTADIAAIQWMSENIQTDKKIS
jgi:hypothetical protein